VKFGSHLFLRDAYITSFCHHLFSGSSSLFYFSVSPFPQFCSTELFPFESVRPIRVDILNGRVLIEAHPRVPPRPSRSLYAFSLLDPPFPSWLRQIRTIPQTWNSAMAPTCSEPYRKAFQKTTASLHTDPITCEAVFFPLLPFFLFILLLSFLCLSPEKILSSEQNRKKGS